MNGNGELTETENVIFYVSYGVLTEFVRINVILTYFATDTATATDTERWKPGDSEARSSAKVECMWLMCCHK